MAVCLPWTRKALWNCKSERDVLSHFRCLARQAGSGSDEAHVSSKNIDQLGQFIHEASTKHPPNASYPRVIFCLEERPVGVVKIKNLINTLRSSIRHRAEFVQLEAPSAHTHPFLYKEDGSRAV